VFTLSLCKSTPLYSVLPYYGFWDESYLSSASYVATDFPFAKTESMAYRVSKFCAMSLGVYPNLFFKVGSALDSFRRNIRVSIEPNSDAQWRGVDSSKSRLFGSDPFSTRSLAIHAWFLIAAI
jgi:hypothetical protein